MFLDFHYQVKNFEISDKRLKWHGIESLEESKPKILDMIYGKDFDCEFDLDGDFKFSCRWNRKITLDEHKSFMILESYRSQGFTVRQSQNDFK